jgi:hypothetical protein
VLSWPTPNAESDISLRSKILRYAFSTLVFECCSHWQASGVPIWKKLYERDGFDRLSSFLRAIDMGPGLLSLWLSYLPGVHVFLLVITHLSFQ